MPNEQNNISAQTDSQSPQAPQAHQTSAEVVIEVNQQETLQRRAGQMLLRPENSFSRQLARNLIFSSFATLTTLFCGNISCLTNKNKETCHQFISGVSVGLGVLVFAGAGVVTACKSRSTSVAPISQLIESAPEIFPTLQTGTGANMNQGSGNIDSDSQTRPSPRPLNSGVASTQTAGSNQTSMSQII
jgi:hypothetical protein